MASFASLLVVLSVSCVAVGGISKRQDTKDDVCAAGSKKMPQQLLNLKEKSAILRTTQGPDTYVYYVGICTNPQTILLEDPECMVIQKATNNMTNPIKCLGKRSQAQLTDTLKLGWIELTYSGGELYGSHCSNKERVSRIFFFCDPSAGEGTPEFIEENREDNYCYYLFNWPTSYICPVVPPAVNPGWYIILVMFILAVLWAIAMVAGVIVQRFVLGAKGWEQIPFLRWYQLFGDLEVDGCNLVCRCNRGREKMIPMTTIGKQPLADPEEPESESESETEHKDEDLIPM